MNGLESVYKRHHTKDSGRKRNHAILSQERSAFLKNFLERNSKVLDIGCRDGELIKFYNDEGNYHITGVDIDSEALEIAREKTGIKTIWADLNGEWDLNNEKFNAVVACEVVEHLYNPAVVFERIFDVLHPGGVLVGSVPHAFALQFRLKYLFGIKKMTPLSDPTHINHFLSSELKSLLNEKFTDVEILGISSPKYSIFKKIFPYLFCHTLLFKAKKPLI